MYLHGTDSRVVCLSYLAYALWFLGEPERALERSEQALSAAHQLSHPFTLAFALAFSTYLRQHMADIAATRRLAEEAIALSTEQGFPFWANQQTMLRGWAMARQGQLTSGLNQLRRGLDAYRALGSGLACPWFLALLAETYHQLGRFAEGLHALDEALATAERSGERFYLAELLRLRGELTLARSGPAGRDDAEACYQRALDLAREQGAVPLQQRASMSLALLWHDRGRQADAIELIEALSTRHPERAPRRHPSCLPAAPSLMHAAATSRRSREQQEGGLRSIARRRPPA
jgi:predicted ATPase